MDQNTRCSVVECREFNEQRLIFTLMVRVCAHTCVCSYSMCVYALRSLHMCQAQHKGGAGTQYVCVSVTF